MRPSAILLLMVLSSPALPAWAQSATSQPQAAPGAPTGLRPAAPETMQPLQAAPPPLAAPKPAPSSPPPAAPAAKAEDRPAAPWGAHLGSFAEAGNVERMWQRYRGKAPEAFTGLEPQRRELTVGGRALHRLLAGPFADRAAASAFCQRVAKVLDYCQPMPF